MTLRRPHRRPRRRRDDVWLRVPDDRSRRVVFLAHCLLNENVRFLGGATRPGVIAETVEPYIRDGVGVVQLPCPEQHAWGGVLKSRMTALYDRQLLRRRPVRRVVVAAARAYSALQYRRLAAGVASQVSDYVDSGFDVVEVVGVGASPSCGVTTTLDLDGAVRAMAACAVADLCPVRVREQVVAANARDGAGMFIAALRRRLARRHVDVAFREHDLLAELPTSSAFTRLRR